MWPYPKFPADLVILTEEIFNGNVQFLHSDRSLTESLMHFSNNMYNFSPVNGNLTKW